VKKEEAINHMFIRTPLISKVVIIKFGV